MENVLGKICKENKNIHFTYNNFSSPEIQAVYEIMSKIAVELRARARGNM